MSAEGHYVPGTAARAAILGGALLLGWMSVRAATQLSFENVAPQLATRVGPASGTALANLARLRVAEASGEIDDTTRELYRSALNREPMLSDPLALAALDAAGRGDADGARRLMVAARNRDPRAPLPRFWLFDHYVRTGQYGLAMDEVGPAIRLQPQAITAMMTVLAAIADNPEGRDALSGKLAEQPFWRTSFFQAAANNASPAAMLTLLSAANPDRAAAAQEQRAVFLAMINAGQGARAYESWRALLPAAYRPRAQGIYDGNFARWPGAQPFNWMLSEDKIGTTQIVVAPDLPQSSALDVRYFGSTAGTLAEQFVYARPGSYRLSLAARRRTSGATGGRLSMEVRCVRGDLVASLPLEPLGGQLRTLSVPVEVAPGCDVLRVSLVGTPGEVFSEIEAQITGVALQPGG